MDPQATTKPPPGNNKIPLRLLVVTTVAVMIGLAVGALTWLSTGASAAAVLAGLFGVGSTFAWLVEHVD